MRFHMDLILCLKESITLLHHSFTRWPGSGTATWKHQQTRLCLVCTARIPTHSMTASWPESSGATQCKMAASWTERTQGLFAAGLTDWAPLVMIAPLASGTGLTKKVFKSTPTKQTQTFVWHLYNVGPMSKTLGRRCINVVQMFCICWE